MYAIGRAEQRKGNKISLVSLRNIKNAMNDLETLIEDYPDLDQFIESIKDDSTTIATFEDSCLKVKLNLIDEYIRIHLSQLDKLCNYEKPDGIPSFKYLDSYGIKFKNYYEICIFISHHGYSFFDDSNNWKTKPLKFKIGKNQFEVGPISNLMVLLTEPIYSDNNSAHYDFHNYASMKIVIGESTNFKEDFCKGLYYLNSYYLKSIGFHAALIRLELLNEDPLDIMFENEVTDVFKKASRKKNIKRKDFKSVEPLNLYNESVLKESEQKFLLLYRIVEFFINRSIIHRIREVRYDSSVSDEEILSTMNLRNEEQQLKTLLHGTLTSSNEKKISKYCEYNGLIDSDEFKKVYVALYKFRNSLVHARETEIKNTKFPNPFDIDQTIDKWIYVIDEIARMCIKKYNENSL